MTGLWCVAIALAAQSQTREMIDHLNEGTCATCRVGVNCQPEPNAGSEGHTTWYNIEDFWGTKQIIVIGGRNFNIFNATEAQVNMIRETIEILPPEYIAILPQNFRIGNPNRPFGIASAGRQIGGSKFCTPYAESNLDFESIVLHEAIFTINNKKHRTILHEIGHFFERKYSAAERMTPEERSQSSSYLTNVYHGITSSHQETVAQCFMFFFHQMYFEGNNRLAIPKTFDQIRPQPARKFYPWMCNFIKPMIHETSSL